MHALVLCGALVCVAADEDKLVQQLDADYAELLKKEKDPQPLREAARLFEQTDRNWTSYAAGLSIIRRTRAKAALPLLLKFMVIDADVGNSHIIVPAYADALVILTGNEVEDPYRYVSDRKQAVRDAVQKIVDDWWKPNKDKITTDLGAMTKEQVQVVIHRMLRQTERFQRDYGSDSTESLSERLEEVFTRDREGRQTWQEAELDAAMVPVLLELAGYDDNPPAKAPARDDAKVLFAGIPMLAALRANGLAPQLDKVAADNRQSSATRLTCLLALHRSGEKLDAPQVVTILSGEKQLERRLVAILALRYSADAKTVSAPLLEALDDPNRNIQTAAICALEGSAPKTALPKLKKVLDELEPPQAVYAAIRTIGRMEGKEPRAALADFMEAAQDDPKKAKYVFQALMAFQDATGHDLIEAGAHPQGYYRDKAKLAVEWWKTQK